MAAFSSSHNTTFPLFSRDGTRLITSPERGFLDILGPGFGSTNRIKKSLNFNNIKGARFSPDGQYVATSSFDGAATLWDAGTLEQVGEKMPHAHWVETIDFSPDGQRIATGSRDRTVRIWEARTGRPLSEPLRHDANVIAVQFSPDGRRILSVCEGKGVWVWEVRSAQPLTAVLQHLTRVNRAVFSPDGERVATTAPGRQDLYRPFVRLWDVPRAIPLLPPLACGDYAVQFSRDGRLLLGELRGIVTVWDSSTGKVVGRPFGGDNRSTYAHFSPDGQLVVIGGGFEGEGEGGAELEGAAVVSVWRIADSKLVAKFSHETTAGFARFSPDGRWVVSTSMDKTARLWDWQTGKPLTEPLRHEGGVVWADVSADSQRVLTLARDQTARIWEASSGRLLHTLSHGGEPYHYNTAEFSADGRRVVIASGSEAQIWDASTGQAVTAALKHAGRVNSVGFSPDGKRLVTSCHDGTARLWDTATGHAVSEPLRHLARVNYAEFSPDGRRVITAASMDGTARIFEVPMLPSAVPPLLADWAEAVAGQRFDEQNASQPVPFAELHRVRQSLAQAPEGDEATRWARWFFAENATRRISPGSSLTVPQFVRQRIQDNTAESLKQAIQLSPNNGLAQARLAFLNLTNTTTPGPPLMAALEWQSRHGVELSPNDPDAWWARAKFFEHLGKTAEAIEAMDRAAGLNSTDAGFWNDRGLLLAKTNRLEEALQSYTKAIELSGPWKDQETLPALAYGNRSMLHRRLNRLTEAAADNLKMFSISPRDPGTPARLIDLSLFYNARTDMWLSPDSIHNFSLLPLGRQILAGGTEFDLRGVIRTATGLDEASGIGIGQKCRKLHFLHVGGGQGRIWDDGKEVGVYRLHYTDGQQKEIPIIYGEHLRFHNPKSEKREALARNTKVAWSGESPTRIPMRLFETTWENERPDVAIQSLDFISRKTGTEPILFAITVEP